MKKGKSEEVVIKVSDVSKNFNVYYDKANTLKERVIFFHRNKMEVRKVLDKNKAERHIRGGMATKLKYSHSKVENL